MTTGMMRWIAPRARLIRARACRVKPFLPSAPAAVNHGVRTFAKVRQPEGVEAGELFSASGPSPLPVEHKGEDGKPPDERTLKLGKTIRILHERLPTLLANPLPQEIISPQVTLHLFPSTHPHLPTVSGRIAYMAALWTAPVAWGRVPILGNVRLDITSERMVRNGGGNAPFNFRQEKLIVKWKTCGKTKGKGIGAVFRGISGIEQIADFLGGAGKGDEEFQGLFKFEFDEEGRIVSHTIEHVEDNRDWEKTTRFISVTDWLLGKAWGKKEPSGLALGYCRTDYDDRTRHGHGHGHGQSHR